MLGPNIITHHALEKLGFRTNPFQDSADPAFLYLGRQHQRIVDRTHDLIYWRQGLAMIEGAIGTGKSTIARHLYAAYSAQAEADAGIQISYLPSADYDTVSVAARALADSLGVPMHRKVPYQMNVIYEHLSRTRQAGKNVVVLWDDCQLMSLPALKLFQLLWNFDVAGKLIQMILFATPAIHVHLHEYPDILDRFAQWDRLSALDPNDAFSLINYRCKVAGREEPLLNESAFKALYDFTGGTPRKMVIICHEILRQMHANGHSIATGDDMIEAIEQYRQRETAP